MARLVSITRSRTEPGRAGADAVGLPGRPLVLCGGSRFGVHHQTVQRCVERALAYGAMAALDDCPRPGREPTITAEAKAWLVSLAYRKAKDLGYPHEWWGFWFATRARTDPPKDTRASASWRRPYLVL